MFNPHEYNPVHLNANIIKILWRQQQELLKHSPEYVTPIINNEDPLDIQIDLEGPKATPYESGKFRVKLLIPNDFPNVAPKGIFITKIFHPNISEKGEICVNTLKKDWNPRQWSLYNLFEVIKCLLIVPFPQSALNEEAGKIFMENYEEYFKIAQMYTKIYAMKNAKTNIKDDDGNNNNNNNCIKETNNIKANNNDDIEMKDSTDNNNDIDIDNNDINNNNLNQSNLTKYDIHINNNIFENIGTVDYRRMSEMPRSNYNLNNINDFNYNNCNNITKSNANGFYQSNIKNNNNNIHNNFINNTNINCFNNMNNNNNNFNFNVENKQFLSSKEKPNLSLLPLMNTKQIKNNNNIFGYHRSLTFNNNSQNNLNYGNFGNNNNNNSQEINKWLMRI